jgi:hypothetical protein
MWQIWTCRYEQSGARALIEMQERELTVHGIAKGVGKWNPGCNCLKGTAIVFEEMLTMCLPCERGDWHVYQSI